MSHPVDNPSQARSKARGAIPSARPFRDIRPAVVMCGLTLLTACRREEYAAPVPPAIEQVPAQVESAFRGAPTEVSAEVQSVLTSVRGDDPGALNQLQELGQRPDLTPAQRAAANQAMYSVLARVAREATNGNPKAAEALEQYRSSK